MPVRSEDDVNELHRLARAGDPAALDALAQRYDALARALAKRRARRAEADDVLQAARCGLVAALRRFDVDRGVQFSTFAFATIEGELKRFSRSARWAVHVPRGTQERYLEVMAAHDEVERMTSRPASTSDVARFLGATEDDVRTWRAVANLHAVDSLDADADGRLDVRARDDAGFDRVEARQSVQTMIGRLPPMEQRVVKLRFFENMTQTDIATTVGCSQMHVSRLLRRALERLRYFATA